MLANKNKNGFSLAEVLITLTIIGVIAAITIPNLLQSWRKHERITQIKTAYSIIQNATKMAVAEYGSSDGWSFNEAKEYAQTYFIPYVKTQKICGVSTSSKYFKGSGCFVDNDKNGTWYSLNGASYDNAHSSGYNPIYYYTMILQNGMHLGVWAPSSRNLSASSKITFLVDVDGAKGQSSLGKDIFTFQYQLSNGKFNTGGEAVNYNQNDCTLTGLGTSCAYWIERNHWEFPDDYPVKKF